MGMVMGVALRSLPCSAMGGLMTTLVTGEGEAAPYPLEVAEEV
jgi:hypothetical protein